MHRTQLVSIDMSSNHVLGLLIFWQFLPLLDSNVIHQTGTLATNNISTLPLKCDAGSS